MNANIEQTVRNLLIEKFEIPEEEITMDATFEDLDLDSLDFVELSMNIEDELGLSISEEEGKELKTVGDVVRLLEAKAN